MEHIVQFAISIDDAAIVKKVQENAERSITNNIQKQVEACIFEIDRYSNKPKKELSYRTEQLFAEWLASNKDEIIQLASSMLAARMIKSKAVKTAIEEVVNNDKT